MLTVTGRMMGLPRRIAWPAPRIVNGTTAAPPRIAITNPPFLNGSSAPLRLRVPSGKTRNEKPARNAAAAVSMAARLCSRLRRSIGTNPAIAKAAGSSGSLWISALYRMRSFGCTPRSAM